MLIIVKLHCILVKPLYKILCREWFQRLKSGAEYPRQSLGSWEVEGISRTLKNGVQNIISNAEKVTASDQT